MSRFTSSALQSRKWQLIDMSWWYRGALCGHPLPALANIIKRDLHKETISFRTHQTSHQWLFAVTVCVARASSSRSEWSRPIYTVFRSVVVAKILYACSAWSGFITASDRHRVDAFLRRSKRCGFCQPDLPSFDQLVEDYEDRLFNKLCNNNGHAL